MDEQPSGDNPDPQDDTQQPMPEPAQETADENQDLNMEDESAPEESAPEGNISIDTPGVSEDSPPSDETTEVSQDSNWSSEPEPPAESGGSVNIAIKGPEQAEEQSTDETPESVVEQNQEADPTVSEEPGGESTVEEEKVDEAGEVQPEQEQIDQPADADLIMADQPQTSEPLSEDQVDVPEAGVPLEDTTPDERVANFIPAPVAKSKSMKRWWIVLVAFVLVAVAAAGAYFLFFMDRGLTEYRDSTLAFSYPEEWRKTDQGQGGLAFYPGETMDSTNAVFLIFTNTAAIDGYSQMTADQKSQVKTRLLDFFVSPEFAQEINGDQSGLEFSNGQEITQKGADMALNFDASGLNSAGLASSGILRVLIGPGGENVTLLAIALDTDWSTNQDRYLDIASNLQVL